MATFTLTGNLDSPTGGPARASVLMLAETPVVPTDRRLRLAGGVLSAVLDTTLTPCFVYSPELDIRWAVPATSGGVTRDLSDLTATFTGS